VWRRGHRHAANWGSVRPNEGSDDHSVKQRRCHHEQQRIQRLCQSHQRRNGRRIVYHCQHNARLQFHQPSRHRQPSSRDTEQQH
jgi:hypothetical protein